MAEIARSRADEYPWPLPISAVSKSGPPPDDEALYRSHTGGDARESTELARLRRNYTRASSHQAPISSGIIAKPTTLCDRFIYAVKRFWKDQVSVTVPHASCRDHLGTYRGPTSIYFQASHPVLHKLSTVPSH